MIETQPFNTKLNWEARIFCFGCGDLMMAMEPAGWDCLSCDGTLRFESDGHWHWRKGGFYDGVNAIDNQRDSEWLGISDEKEELDVEESHHYL